MAWSQPKTNWKIEVVDGEYLGDFFNASDFNRIKNNLEHLRELAITLYEDFSIIPLGEDKKPSDYFYADEINIIEDNLAIINEHTMNRDYGINPLYSPNEVIMDIEELNRIESATLDLYEKLTTEFNGRRTLTFNFGIKEVL